MNTKPQGGLSIRDSLVKYDIGLGYDTSNCNVSFNCEMNNQNNNKSLSLGLTEDNQSLKIKASTTGSFYITYKMEF